MSVTILNKKYDINLQTFDLYNKKLSSLPTEIGNLINLQILNVFNNQLSSLPAEIGNLINLQGELYSERFQLFFFICIVKIFILCFYLFY